MSHALVASLGLALLAAIAPVTASAQAAAKGPLRVIVPFPPGGATDAIARGLSQPLAKSLGTNVIVDNRPGANAIIGMEACARAAPDGQTVCIANNDAINFNPVLYAKLPYDPARDLVPVARVGEIQQVIVAHASVPANSLKEVIELSRAQPGTISFSSFGMGSMGHLYVEWFNRHAGASFNHIPYRGAGPALEAVFKGEVKLSLFAIGAALPHLKAGTIKALAVVDNKRLAALPEVPALTELGYGFVARAWLGMFAPRGTPADAIGLLSQEVNRALADPEFKQNVLAKQVIDAAPLTPEQFAEFIRSDARTSVELLKAAGIRLD